MSVRPLPLRKNRQRTHLIARPGLFIRQSHHSYQPPHDFTTPCDFLWQSQHPQPPPPDATTSTPAPTPSTELVRGRGISIHHMAILSFEYRGSRLKPSRKRFCASLFLFFFPNFENENHSSSFYMPFPPPRTLLLLFFSMHCGPE